MSPSRPAGSPQPIDDVECFVAFEPLNYTTERSAEVPDIFVKREIFRPNVVLRARRLRGLSHRK
jgi:hypothetical protein